MAITYWQSSFGGIGGGRGCVGRFELARCCCRDQRSPTCCTLDTIGLQHLLTIGTSDTHWCVCFVRSNGLHTFGYVWHVVCFSFSNQRSSTLVRWAQCLFFSDQRSSTFGKVGHSLCFLCLCVCVFFFRALAMPYGLEVPDGRF